jgi:ribosomal protein L37AE/L43A
MYNCVSCGQSVAKGRWALGIHFCMDCGELRARAYKHTIVPMHKSNYVPIYNMRDLVGINSKGGDVKYV